VTTDSVWGSPAKGVALSAFTNGTLDWIGCPSDGCTPDQFFCNDEPTGIYFGTTTAGFRAVVDPGNAGGASYPTSSGGCASAGNPRGISNAPRGDNDGQGGLNAGDALCKAMGFASGTVVRESSFNTCPRPYSTTSNGSNWTSTWTGSNPYNYGVEYRCTR
jgi:hypothetical protein